MERLYSTWLPLCPSLNQAYPTGKNGRRFKSRECKAWEREANFVCNKGVKITEPVSIVYTIYFRDRRSGDLSNRIKLVEDFLVDRGILPDDSHEWIKSFTVHFGGYDKRNHRIEVEIFRYG